MATTTMNLVDSGQRAGLGAVAGVAVILLAGHLNLGPIFRDPDLTMALVVGVTGGAILGAVGRAWWLLVPNAILLVCYFAVTGVPVMDQVAARWVRDDGPPGRQDAIVVLSAYVQPDSALNGVGTERLLYGIELLQAGVAPTIVTSRLRVDDSGIRRTSSDDQRRLLGLAGATSAWIEVDSIGSTRDEAVGAAARLLPAGMTRIAVVTSPFHTRRACAAFEAVGFTVSCQPSRERQMPIRHPTFGEARLTAFGEYVYERLGMIKYHSRGWVR
jgi:uncharacterized SAM-binding protein YcdF (DUF218 family)